ncbi:Leucine-rich-repeats and calponin-like proteiny domain protein [Aphelenchoides fujianensis]|nr:Leucine-rich-repeats and calponin-like proteiny domain protein [Aphelenchoides fujianensis]
MDILASSSRTAASWLQSRRGFPTAKRSESQDAADELPPPTPHGADFNFNFNNSSRTRAASKRVKKSTPPIAGHDLLASLPGCSSSSNQLAMLNLPCDKMFADAFLTGELDLRGRQLKEFPLHFAHSFDIRDLIAADLSLNRFTTLPPLDECHSLERLELRSNALRTLPAATLLPLHSLTFLDLANNQLNELPAALFNLPRLKVLLLNNNRLEQLPTDVRHLADSLEEASDYLVDSLIVWLQLDLAANRLRQIPPVVSVLTQLRVLNLRANQLTSLRILDLSANLLIRLPTEFHRLADSCVDFRTDGNPLLEPPTSVAQRGRAHVFKWLLSRSSRTRPLNESMGSSVAELKLGSVEPAALSNGALPSNVLYTANALGLSDFARSTTLNATMRRTERRCEFADFSHSATALLLVADRHSLASLSSCSSSAAAVGGAERTDERDADRASQSSGSLAPPADPIARPRADELPPALLADASALHRAIVSASAPARSCALCPPNGLRFDAAGFRLLVGGRGVAVGTNGGVREFEWPAAAALAVVLVALPVGVVDCARTGRLFGLLLSIPLAFWQFAGFLLDCGQHRCAPDVRRAERRSRSIRSSGARCTDSGYLTGDDHVQQFESLQLNGNPTELPTTTADGQARIGALAEEILRTFEETRAAAQSNGNPPAVDANRLMDLSNNNVPPQTKRPNGIAANGETPKKPQGHALTAVALSPLVEMRSESMSSVRLSATLQHLDRLRLDDDHEQRSTENRHRDERRSQIAASQRDLRGSGAEAAEVARPLAPLDRGLRRVVRFDDQTAARPHAAACKSEGKSGRKVAAGRSERC